MNKEYSRNKKIKISGTAKAIADAEAVLDTVDCLEGEFVGYRLNNEGKIRLKIQESLDTHNLKASIMVDGNNVYPYRKIISQYDQLKKSGKLEKMTDAFYQFLYLNFDIAHYDKGGYIDYYNNDFWAMKRAVLDNATTPGWHTDVQRILNYIQDRAAALAA